MLGIFYVGCVGVEWVCTITAVNRAENTLAQLHEPGQSLLLPGFWVARFKDQHRQSHVPPPPPHHPQHTPMRDRVVMKIVLRKSREMHKCAW
jgi:hypothetical protein